MASNRSLLVVGAGGHSKACLEIIESVGKFTVSGLIGVPSEVGKTVGKWKVIGSDQDLGRLRESHEFAFIAIGQLKNPLPRIKISQKLLELDFELPIILSPHSIVSPSAVIQPGSIVMQGAVVGAEVQVGRNCILNTKCVIEHDSRVGDFCHISTSVTINGNVNIGNRTFIGSGSTLRNNVSVGDDSVIPMGSLVTRNVNQT